MSGVIYSDDESDLSVVSDIDEGVIESELGSSVFSDSRYSLPPLDSHLILCAVVVHVHAHVVVPPYSKLPENERSLGWMKHLRQHMAALEQDNVHRCLSIRTSTKQS